MQPDKTIYNTPESHFQHAIRLMQSGNYEDAANFFEQLSKIDPNSLPPALGWCHCQHLQKKYTQALLRYDQLTLLFPNSQQLWNNRGVTLMAIGRHIDAASSFEHALDIDKNLHTARIALASCYQALGFIEQAKVACQKVINSDPENAEAHWNYALLLLLEGNYTDGWKEYEWRWKRKTFSSPKRNFEQPQWDGLEISGKTLLIHAEQGFGDTIQFCRYIPKIAESGISILFECHPELLTLMKNLDKRIKVIPRGEKLPHFDLHIPLLSLPYIFHTTLQTIPDPKPYLRSNRNYIVKGSEVLAVDKNIKVGLCWSGKSYPDPFRSCPVDELLPLYALSGVSWYSLQKGWNLPLPFPMNDITSDITDFADTAGVISQLDLIISIDTSVAHLAGTLGKETWIMLPFAPDWRWMLQRKDSPWYPSVQLFRQPLPGLWKSVISDIISSINDKLKERKY